MSHQKTNGQISYSEQVCSIHQGMSTIYSLGRKQLSKSNRWCSSFITFRDGNTRASHRSTYSLWRGEMVKALCPPIAMGGSVSTVSTADRKEHHSSSVQVDENIPPFLHWTQITPPFTLLDQGPQTVFHGITLPFPPRAEGPLVHHHLASPWPTLSRKRGQQGPQEALCYLVTLYGHSVITDNAECFLRVRAMRH